MSEDEEVDGAAVAALILSCMSRPDRERALDSMQKASPKSAKRVKLSLLDLALKPQHESPVLPLPTVLPVGPEEPAPAADEIAAAIRELLAGEDAPDARASKSVVTKRVEDAYPSASSRIKKTQ